MHLILFCITFLVHMTCGSGTLCGVNQCCSIFNESPIQFNSILWWNTRLMQSEKNMHKNNFKNFEMNWQNNWILSWKSVQFIPLSLKFDFILTWFIRRQICWINSIKFNWWIENTSGVNAICCDCHICCLKMDYAYGYGFCLIRWISFIWKTLLQNLI